MVAAATTTSRSDRMRASLKRTRLLALTSVGAFAFMLGCANKQAPSGQPAASALAALPDLPEPRGLLGELTVSHPGASFTALRELAGPISAVLPAGFPMLVASAFGLPALAADSFDPDLPLFGALLQGTSGEPGWLLAVHAVSGPELVAKLCTGDNAPFRAGTSGVAGLTLLQPSSVPSNAGANPKRALAVFDNYLLVASESDSLLAAGPYAARMLPKQAPSTVPLALRFSKQALSGQVVPALRGLWAGYRTNLRRSDEADRSAHGGHAPDFADSAQIILSADALVESLLSLIDDATTLELDLDPFPSRLDATLLLQADANSEAQRKIAALAPGTADALSGLPGETQFALGFSRTPGEREAAGKAAGDDWVRVLGSRLSDAGAAKLRAELADWELGRGSESSYGLLSGSAPGAYLVVDVADAARLKRAGPGLFGLLSLPGLRAPLIEFLGQPHVSESVAPPNSLPNAVRKQITFTPASGHKTAAPPLSVAWLVNDQRAFAAAGKNADVVLKRVLESAQGQGETLATAAKIADAVQRIGDQAAVFAYADARAVGLVPDGGAPSAVPAPILLALGKRGNGASLRIEISKPAIDLALHGALGF
jgi:hypothetical protein